MAHALRDKAAISGVGDTAYTRGTTKSGLALQLEASLRAIEDAGLSPRDIVEFNRDGELFARFFFVQDPDGYKIEVLQRRGRYK